MTRSHLVALDLDGVLSMEFTIEIYKELERRGFAVDRSRYDMGVPHEDLVAAHDAVVMSDQLLRCALDPGVGETLKALSRFHSSFVLTARSFMGSTQMVRDKIEADTRLTVQRWAIPGCEEVVFCEPWLKGDICVKRAAGVIMEDSPINLEHVWKCSIKHSRPIKMFLVPRLYNRGHRLHDKGVVELTQFGDVVKHLMPSTLGVFK